MKQALLTLMSLLIAGSVAAAQKPQPAAASQKTPAPAKEQPTPKANRSASEKPEPQPQPLNVKIEFTITDQAGATEPARKVVSMIVGDRQNNSIRTTGSVRVTDQAAPGAARTFHYREVRINVDAHPVLLKDGKISLNFGLEYLPTGPGRGEESSPDPGLSSLNERMGLLLESGKAIIVSQAADPASDRRITVELTATILR